MPRRRGRRKRARTSSEPPQPGFSQSEVERMEKIISEKDERLLDETFCQKLADEFNTSGRAGTNLILAEQIEEWFQNKLKTDASMSDDVEEQPPQTASEKVLPADANQPNSDSKHPAKDDEDKELDGSELEFEARSSRDGAWYDIDWFLGNRLNKDGEVEVLVRYKGFGPEEDEWVNVKESVRDRSVPLESSECNSIAEGDHVLCFRENEKEALHFDAHVVSIQKKLHDIRGCRCVFKVRYDHDQAEESVSLRRLCRRTQS